MHIIHKEIWVPKILEQEIDLNTSKFVIWPLPRWYGITIWNTLRRILLSSIPWARATWIKIKWISHEYTTLPWINESVIDIMLNLKDLVIDKKEIWVEWLKLSKDKAWVVSAKDIKTPAWVEILNKDLYITKIDKDWLKLDIDIRIEKWVWYLSTTDLKEREEDLDTLIIDANFSPVLNVKYESTNTRYGDILNLDSLELTITTNSVVSPVDALKFSWAMLSSYFSLFNEESLQVEWHFIWNVKDLITKEKQEIKEELEKESYTPIEIMGLSPRTLNALINWSVLSIEQLTKCTETKLSSIKWFGKKAMTEIKEALWERWLKLLWDE